MDKIRRMIAGLLFLLSASATLGSTFTVTNTNDSGAGSLREAVAFAANGDTINFSLAFPATIALSTPIIFGPSVTISGPGADGN